MPQAAVRIAPSLPAPDFARLGGEAGADRPRLDATDGRFAPGTGPGPAVVSAPGPTMPLPAVENVLDLCDPVPVMSVNPGVGGQSFLESQLPKTAAPRRVIDGTGRPVALEVDGGVPAEAAPRRDAANDADTSVAGAAAPGAPDRARATAAPRRGGSA